MKMAPRILLSALLITLLTGCASSPPNSPASPASPAVLTDLAPTGKLRAAINYGNSVLAKKDARTGEPGGVSVDLARRLGQRLGVPVELVGFDAAGKVFDALSAGLWDVAFLAIEPARAAEIAFTAPYVLIEGTYLVRQESPLRSIAEFDRPGIRIAVGNKSAYDLYLTRTLKNAQLIRAQTSPAAIEQFLNDKLEAVAGVKQPLVAYANKNPAVRVIEGRFMAIQQAMGTPKSRVVGATFLQQFVEEMKASGLVAASLQRSGELDALVAPAAR